jgi:tetratricopeptide (TPR) repeat protein
MMHPARIAIVAGLAVGVALGAQTSARAQESAVAAARAAARSHGNDPSSALALGRALRRAGRYREAIAELRRGAATIAGREAAAAIKLHYEIARTYIAQRDFSQAMVACRVAAAQTGGAAEGHACAAEADLLWRRATDAVTELHSAGRTYHAKVAEGRALALQLKDAQAEAAFRDAMTLDPSGADPHLYLGTFWASTGKTDQAIPELRRAVELDPTSPDALYELGRNLPAGPDALTALDKATRERPSFLDAWVKLAEVDLALGKTADAAVAAAAALHINAQDASAHVVVGRVALAGGKPDDALREARAALGVLANSAPAKLLMADAYAKKGDIDLALEQYQAAYGLDRQNADILVHAALACIKAGRLTSARAYATTATHDHPTWGPAFVALGDALAADGDSAGARAAYTKALSAQGPIDAASVRAKLGALH